jgi:murein DD-endopeptidase MepM/ murein hydrolase activator NlpD
MKYQNKRLEPTSRNRYVLPFDKALNLNPKPAPLHEKFGWIHSLDFEMPEGTPILAAGKGIVWEVEDRFSKGGLDEALECNRIIIEHKNGEYTDYVHLMLGGVLVEDGQRVIAGEHIGYSGSTGYADYPHLHFSVLKVGSEDYWKTVIPRFKDGNRTFVLRSPSE